MKKILSALCVSLLTVNPSLAFEIDPSACYQDGWTKEKYLELKSNKFELPDDQINKVVGWLDHCLADPDPIIRDGVAYEAFATWLRAGKINGKSLSSMYGRMSAALREGQTDKHGVYLPFVALVYSEVVRVDRITPHLDDTLRQKVVDTISLYLAAISDYRGFEDGVGWRHAVAHGSDVVLQLALNREIEADQLLQLAGAIASQVNADGKHFYIFGEPERLARATAYLILRDEVEISFWQDWLKKVSSPAPFDAWGEVFMSESGLAKRNNIRQFLTNLYAMIASSKNERLVEITPIVAEMIGNTG